jgi:hypothetical protein
MSLQIWKSARNMSTYCKGSMIFFVLVVAASVSSVSSAATEATSSSWCDRRMSRSARDILRNYLIKTWHDMYQTTMDSKFNIDVTKWTIWQLLNATIIQANDDSHPLNHDLLPTCPLRSENDIYREQEESTRIMDSSIVIPNRIRSSAIPGILHETRSNNKNGHRPRQIYPVVYHCIVCQKNFTSHYYLDQHFESRHPPKLIGTKDTTPNKNFNPSNDDSICPADTYCSFLSLHACYDHAMVREPYYGPGISSSDSNIASIICTDQEQQTSIVQCYEIVALCFEGVFGHILSTNICSAIPSHCHTRSMHLSLSRFSWYEIWNNIYEHHSTFNWLILMIVACVFMIVYGLYIHQIIQSILQEQSQQKRKYQERIRRRDEIYVDNSIHNNSNSSLLQWSPSRNGMLASPSPVPYIIPGAKPKMK